MWGAGGFGVGSGGWWLGLDELCFFFSLLFYSFIPNINTYYSFPFAYYSIEFCQYSYLKYSQNTLTHSYYIEASQIHSNN